MINLLGEEEVLDKIEDIRLRPSRYIQLFQESTFDDCEEQGCQATSLI